ncbi:MAG: LexA family transcriptional regulator [Prevotella sp.]|jgi:DNA polymerase V
MDAKDNDLSEQIAFRIRNLLKDKHLKQKDLARQLGKTEAEVSKWVRGSHNFTIDTLHLIEDALDAPIINVEKKRKNRRQYRKRQEHGNEVEFIKSEFSQDLTLRYAPGVKAGFPSPAEQYEVEALDFNRDMIAHPDTTFYARVMGDSMIDAGITEGDIVVVDRSIEPQNKDIVIAFYDHQYTLKYYDDSHKDEGYIQLIPANKKYPVFKITDGEDFLIWGVVKYTIKTWHR